MMIVLNFLRLYQSRGAFDPAPGGGGGGDALIMEDGASYFLLEDGTSRILLES
jgi:hypothetical protein